MITGDIAILLRDLTENVWQVARIMTVEELVSMFACKKERHPDG